MNDPHVVALIYKIEHDPTVDYENANPLEFDTPAFSVRIKNDEARFELKDHFPTAEAAREALEPFLRAWELKAGLERRPDELTFEYGDCEITDRNPTPGFAGTIFARSKIEASLDVRRRRNQYPPLPQHIAVNPDVQSMYDRYKGYTEGSEPLAAMAYFCFTVIQSGAKNRQTSSAAKKFRIERSVLSTLAKLASEKGGPEARKATGAAEEYTSSERAWLEATIKAIIRRAAEVAYGPDRPLKMITMDDLPKL